MGLFSESKKHCAWCGSADSEQWWKCCPVHTTERGSDVLCTDCAAEVHNWNVIEKYKVKAYDLVYGYFYELIKPELSVEEHLRMRDMYAWLTHYYFGRTTI